MFETRKIHLSVPLEVYEFIRENRLFKNIDGIIVEFLIEKYGITLK